jgi:hypothetical protein
MGTTAISSNTSNTTNGTPTADTHSSRSAAHAATSTAHLHSHSSTSAPHVPSTIEETLGSLTEEVRAIRTGLSATLRQRLIAVAGRTAPNVPITLHANPDPWATGAFAPLPEGEPGAEVLVANCWGDPATDATRLARLKELSTSNQRVGAYVLALPPRPADAEVLADQLRTYAKAGASEFHLYHAGLASPQRLAALTTALRLLS